MVLEIAINRESITEDEYTYAYTVHLDSHRILTVVTYTDSILIQWLKSVLKSPPNTATKNIILVGVKAETEYTEFTRSGLKDSPYSILTLNIGSHSIIYHLPYTYEETPRLLASFFQNPKVFAIGRDMANVGRRLKKLHGIEIRNAVDVNEVAVKGLKREDLDLGRYGMDRLARAVFGKKMDVVWPAEDIKWFVGGGWRYYRRSWELSNEKVKFCTVDTYLCFLIGLELIDSIEGVSGFEKKNNNKKKK